MRCPVNATATVIFSNSTSGSWSLCLDGFHFTPFTCWKQYLITLTIGRPRIKEHFADCMMKLDWVVAALLAVVSYYAMQCNGLVVSSTIIHEHTCLVLSNPYPWPPADIVQSLRNSLYIFCLIVFSSRALSFWNCQSFRCYEIYLFCLIIFG